MPYVVTAKVSHGSKRATSHKFDTKAEAQKYARDTAKHRPGSNPRVKKAK